MRNRGRHRRLQGVGGSGEESLTGNDILTIADNGTGGDLLVTTAAPHGIEGSPTVAISGTSVGDYNGVQYTALPEGTPNKFVATPFDGVNGFYTADASGGRWDLV